MLNIQDRHGNRIEEVSGNSHAREMRHVSLNLRADDFDEVFASTGESPHLAIEESMLFSLRKWIMYNSNNEPVAVLGVRPITMFSRTGIPWFLGTDGLDKMKRFFLSISKRIISEMTQGFNLLVNFVDARYTKSVRWLEWCGFIVEDPEPFGALQLPFHKFYMELT